MMKTLLSLITVLLFSFALTGQVAINKTGTAPVPSAVLEVSSTTAGLLTPRMTSLQRIGIVSPPDGMIVYQTDGATDFYYSRAGAWNQLNAKQAVHNEVTMGAVPIAAPNGTFAATGVTLANVGVGVMQVNHPAFGVNIPVKLITPMFNEIPSPPSIPADLCKPNFTNNCGYSGTTPTYQHSLVVGVASPPTFGAPPTPTQFRICHSYGTNGNLCTNNTAGDYWYYGFGSASLTPSHKCGFVGSAYNNTAGVQPGDQYELLLRGNAQTISSRYTALSVFIDWNRDADFFDAGESVYSTIKKVWPATYGGTGTLTPPLTVPATAVTGDCTMRTIASKIDNNNQPCLSTAEGSAKDLSFFVVNGAAPTYPAQNAFCNLNNQTTTSFRVRCYDIGGTPINTKVHILIKPF